MLAYRRGLRLVSARTAFGDASEQDAQNQTRADSFKNNNKIICHTKQNKNNLLKNLKV